MSATDAGLWLIYTLNSQSMKKEFFPFRMFQESNLTCNSV